MSFFSDVKTDEFDTRDDIKTNNTSQQLWLIWLQTCGRSRLRRFRSSSGWAAVHREPSFWASSALKKLPSKRCASRKKRTLNTCENLSIPTSSASSKSISEMLVCSALLGSRCVSFVLSRVLGVCALRRLVTASSWSTVPRVSFMKFWERDGKWPPGCWLTGLQALPAAWTTYTCTRSSTEISSLPSESQFSWQMSTFIHYIHEEVLQFQFSWIGRTFLPNLLRECFSAVTITLLKAEP